MNIRKAITSIGLCLTVFTCMAQSKLVKQINQANDPSVALAPFRFLASDELMGRATYRPEINVASLYISEQFRSMGVKEVQGTTGYYQPFNVKFFTPSATGSFTFANSTYEIGEDLLQVRGIENVSLHAPVVFVGYGAEADFNATDVKGKIVVTWLGASDSTAATEMFENAKAKREMALEKGAIALVQLFQDSPYPWDVFQKYYTGARYEEGAVKDIPVFLLNDPNNTVSSLLQNETAGTIEVMGNQLKDVAARNVLGWIEGTDPKLKHEFVVLSAHYDHVGVANKPKMEEGKLDSIYNGARDNAIGATAVINAARYFAKHPAKRSILLIAYSGEELGLLGSQHFAEHPVIPLQQMVYNLNIDNTSYNDTTRITLIGMGRTTADEDIKRACAAFDLTALPDPAPEEELFDRSDNVSLAAKGIPAPTFSLGIKKFDETITDRYHQLSDEVENFNLSYAMKYIKSYILAAKYIADNKARPQWVKGDKYEAASKALYSNKPL